ncbi:MAG: hypothetical protein R3C18_20345 [Planctomycetaceae bacterium]
MNSTRTKVNPIPMNILRLSLVLLLPGCMLPGCGDESESREGTLVTQDESTPEDETHILPGTQLADPPQFEKEFVINFGFLRNAGGERLDETPYVFAGAESFVLEDYAKQLQREAKILEGNHVDVRDVDVIIRVDQEVSEEEVDRLIQQAKDVGFQKFQLKTVSPETGQDD